MTFNPLKEGAIEVFDPETEGAVALEDPPRRQPLNQPDAEDRAEKVWDDSVEYQLPTKAIERLSAAPEYAQMKKAGFIETLKEEWADPIRLGNKIPIAGALFGVYEMVEIMRSAKRLQDPDYDYAKPFFQDSTFGQEVGPFLGQRPRSTRQKQAIYFTKKVEAKIVENYLERVTK